jgi:peptidase S41-like protein
LIRRFPQSFCRQQTARFAASKQPADAYSVLVIDTMPGTNGALVEALSAWIDRLLPDHGRAERLVAQLRSDFGHDRSAVTEESVGAVLATGRRHCRHLELEFVADGSLLPDTEPPGWPAVDPDDSRRRSGWVRQVTHTRDGVGILAVDNLDPVHLAARFLHAAFVLLQHARGVVLDLRDNGGGDPGTVALLMEWVLGPTVTHYADVVHRDGTRQWWTTGRNTHAALPDSTPLSVLVGPKTYSSAEALAYFLRNSTRATVIGEPTPGAADHVTPIAVTTHVRGLLPEAYYLDATTADNWEGAGVQPDLACPAAEALAVALQHLDSDAEVIDTNPVRGQDRPEIRSLLTSLQKGSARLR